MRRGRHDIDGERNIAVDDPPGSSRDDANWDFAQHPHPSAVLCVVTRTDLRTNPKWRAKHLDAERTT